jgi:hypothetical protein
MAAACMTTGNACGEPAQTRNCHDQSSDLIRIAQARKQADRR